MAGGTVSRVVASRHPQFRAGDLVLGNAGWQDYAVSDGEDLLALGEMAQPSLRARAVSACRPSPPMWACSTSASRKPGETVVVAAATGAVGVGRRADRQAQGCARGRHRRRRRTSAATRSRQLGFDACLDRREPKLAERLAAACPKGIDVYFENVGGEVLDAVLPLLNVGARIPLCGFIAHYNDDVVAARPEPAAAAAVDAAAEAHPHAGLHHPRPLRRPLTPPSAATWSDWVAAGQVKLREDVVDGLENAPAAFIGLLEGRNFGKLVVRVAD